MHQYSGTLCLPFTYYAGVRSLEIDLYPDPAGGVYDQSIALKIGGTNGWLNNTELQSSGFKVYTQTLNLPSFLTVGA